MEQVRQLSVPNGQAESMLPTNFLVKDKQAQEEVARFIDMNRSLEAALLIYKYLNPHNQTYITLLINRQHHMRLIIQKSTDTPPQAAWSRRTHGMNCF